MTTSTLKVNFSPFLIDVVLSGTVDSLRHKAKVRNGVLKITLFKASDNQVIWGSLEVANKEERDVLRQSSSLKQREIEEKLLEQRKDRKVADERHSVRKQMALEEAERNRLEGKKDEEKCIAEEEVYATFSKLQPSSVTSDGMINKNDIPVNKKCNPMADPITKCIQNVDEKSKTDDLLANAHDISTVDSVHVQACYNDYDPVSIPLTEDSELKYIPPPRSSNWDSDSRDVSSSTVNINFTPRVFPTPMRESTQANEEDWIAKNRKHLKKHGTLGKNIPKGMHAPRIFIMTTP